MPEGADRRKGPPALADLALVAVAAIWGATFPIVREAVAGIRPVDFLAIRFLLASVLLIPIVGGRVGFRALLDPHAVLPGICLATGYALQTQGLRTVGPSVSAFLTGTSVVIVPLLGRILGWERASARRWGAVLLAIVGICLLQGRLPDRWSAGETMTAGCALAFALQILLIGRAAPRRSNALALGAGQILVATVLLCVVATLRGDLPSAREIPARVWLAVGLTGLLATALAFVVQTWAQERIPSGHVAVCFATEPLFAALVSIGFYGDSISRGGWIGAAAVLAATCLVATEGRRPFVEGESGVC